MTKSTRCTKLQLKLLLYIQVDKANPSFPRQAGVWWFGCSSTKGREKRDISKIGRKVLQLRHKGDGQFSDEDNNRRSDVPPRFDPNESEGEGTGRSGFSSIWDVFAKRFNGFFRFE